MTATGAGIGKHYNAVSKFYLVVVEMTVDGEAMAPYPPLVTRRPFLAPPQNPSITLCPHELGGAIVIVLILCPMRRHA